MIPIDKLRAVRTIITHANCPDGVASALILRQALRSAEVVFLNAGSPELKAWKHGPGELWCDLSPAQPYSDTGTGIYSDTIVLDHHVTAKTVVESYPLGVYADMPGVSGAALAYEEVFARVYGRTSSLDGPVWRLKSLAGIRDTWQTKDPSWKAACAQAEALRFYPWERLAKLQPSEWDDALAIGDIILEKTAERTAQILKEGTRLLAGDTRIFAFNGRETSDVAEALASEVDLVVGFVYAEDSTGDVKLQLSLRSRGDFDCAGFAKSLKGGGHARAAGCSVLMLHSDAQPYWHVVSLIRGFLGRSLIDTLARAAHAAGLAVLYEPARPDPDRWGTCEYVALEQPDAAERADVRWLGEASA